MSHRKIGVKWYSSTPDSRGMCIAYSEEEAVEIENIPGFVAWTTGWEDIETAFNKTLKRTRIALFTSLRVAYGESFQTTKNAHTNDEAAEFEKDLRFIRWLTDWIEYVP